MAFQEPSQKVYLQTWGCQMNVADSERMLSLLRHHQYEVTSIAEESDLILLNTCHIREKATHKVLSQLGIFKKIKEARPQTVIAVAGCVAQLEAKQLRQSCPEVDLIIGPDQIEKLPELVLEVRQSHDIKTLTRNQFDQASHYDIPIDVVSPWRPESETHVTRFVNIIKGCNNFCSFCVVPFTRGREKSRNLNQILEEARWHLERGTQEIVLLGQNVNSYGFDQNIEYHKDWNPFAWLLLQTAQLPGLKWLRFTTSNPHDFTDDLPKAFAIEPKLGNSFHLPLQSGSNEILERMKRKYTKELYLEKANQLRAVRPNIALTTDIIVGFPGETEEDFQETLTLVEKVRYSGIYAFKYSPRRGTAAARFQDQIDESVKGRRLNELFAKQKMITKEQNQSFQNQNVEVLIQYQNKRDQNEWYGRTYEGRLVKVCQIPQSFSQPIGRTAFVKIEKANETALQGRFQEGVS
jgi:tRNA-2-methylthio-N6-dimethylallyladenosine synthase